MAGDLNREFDRLLDQLKNLGASTREINSMKKAFRDAGGDVEQMNAELSRMQGELDSLQSRAVSATLPFRDLTQILAQNASELESTGKFIGKVATSFNLVKNIGRDLLNDSMGVTDLSRDQLQSKLETLKVQRQNLKLAKQEALAEKAKLEAAIAARGARGATNTQKDQLKQLQSIIDYNADQDAGLSGIIQKTEDRLLLEDKIEKQMGVTGALVTGTGALMERLGMRSGIFHTAMEKASEKMREMSRATAEGTENFSRLETIAAGFNILAQGFGKALFSLEGAVLAIVNAFLEVNKAATETVHLTGQNAVYTQGLNTRLATTVQFLETTAELTKQTGRNAQNIFSPDVIAGAAELKNTMGLAANEAGGLAIIAQTTTGDIDGVTNAIVDTTSQFNKANRSAVSQGQILRDVATAGDGVKASLSGNPKLLAEAASAARRLGMELSQLDSIASSLMNFESSIEAELEAQLLTGKNINMAKARELALNNDLAGLGKELFKNSSDILEFGKMNRIQQEAQAKALGMTRDQLAKVAYQRALDNGMTDEAAEKAAGVNAEEMKRIAVQEKIQMLMSKLAQAFTPILEALVPIVDTFTAIIAPLAGFVGYIAQGVAAVLKFPPVLFAIKAALIGIAAVKAFNFLSGIASGIKNMAALTAQMNAFAAAKAAGHSDRQILAGFAGKAAKDATQITKAQIIGMKARNAVMSIGNKIRTVYNKLLDGSIWRSIKEKAAIVGSYIAEKTRNIVKGIGNSITKISNSLQNISILNYLKEKAAIIGSYIAEKASNVAKAIGNSIRSIANGLQNISILNYLREKGAIVLSTIATLANTVAQTAWNAVKNIQIGTMIRSAGLWIAEKARMIADTAARWLNVGATTAQTAARGTQAAVNSTLAGSQTLLGTTGAAAGGGLAAAGAGLGAFGVAAAPAIPIILALGAALLMASPAIYALGQMMVGLATVLGNVIIKALEMLPTIIDAVAQGFVTMLGAITFEKIAALGLLGYALISVAGGLAILSFSMFAALPAIGMLGALAHMAGPLSTLVAPLTAIAAGFTSFLGAITFEKIAALALLGPALISAAAGLAFMSYSMLAALPAIGMLGALALMGTGLEKTATSLSTIATSIKQISDAISNLELTKIEELKDLISTSAMAAPLLAAQGAITGLVGGTNAEKETTSSNTDAKLDELIAAVRAGQIVKVYTDPGAIKEWLEINTSQSE